MSGERIEGEPAVLAGICAAINRTGDARAYARSLDDGRVQIVITGPAHRIRRALVACAHPELHAAWVREKAERSKS